MSAAPELLALGIDLLSYFRGACVQVLVRRLALVPEGGVERFAERGISAASIATSEPGKAFS